MLALTLGLIFPFVWGGGCRHSPTTGSEPGRRESRTASPPDASGEVQPSSPLPEGFPSDVPIYPGATVLVSRRTAAQLAVTFTTSDGLSLVLAFYRERLPREGWDVREREPSEGTLALDGRKGLRTCRVELTEDHARTYIALVLPLAPEAEARE